VRLARRNIGGVIPIIITAIVSLSIGIAGFSLVHVLLVMMPISLVAAWVTRKR
jgi:chromate transporter